MPTTSPGTESESVDRLFTVGEVAEILSLTPRTVRNYLRDGKLTGIKINSRDWRIRQSDLKQYAHNNHGKKD